MLVVKLKTMKSCRVNMQRNVLSVSWVNNQARANRFIKPTSIVPKIYSGYVT